jgi:type VI secretion system protein ImpL
VSRLAQLAAQPLVALAVIAVLLVILVWLLRRLLQGAQVPAQALPQGGDLAGDDGSLTYLDLRPEAGSHALARTFRQARRVLRRASPDHDLYRLPWYLLLGETAAGKTTLAGHTGLALPWGAPPAERTQAPRAGVGFWIFETGVVLDVLGSYVLRQDGQSSDEAGWLSLLGLLRRSRPRRPVDGVVLVVPAPELVAAGRDVLANQTAAAQRASRLYSKLVEAELILGMRLPVHLLVTQSDELAGFTDWCAPLSLRLERQIFGWANPAPVDSPFQSAWTGQAYATILGRMGELEAPAGAAAVTEPTSPFSASLAATQPALEVYANHLFAAAGVGSPLLWRSLSFCGGRFAEAGSPEDQACCAAPERVLFVHDLVADKVFAEDGLAQPTATAVEARRTLQVRLRWGTLVVALLGALALGWGVRSVSRDAASVEPLVETLGEGLADPEALSTATWVRSVLAGSQGIEHYQPRSAALPASWLSPLHPQIREVFVRGYGEVLFPTTAVGLEERLADLERPVPIPPLDPALREVQGVDRMPQFLALDGYVDATGALEGAANAYSCLGQGCERGRRQLEPFAQLTRYLYRSELDLPNREAELFYAGVLGRIRFPPWDYRAEDARQLQERTRTLHGALEEALFPENVLLECLERLVQEIDQLETPLGSASTASVEAYQRVDAEIQLASWLLVQPELAWMAIDPLDLGPGMDEVYANIPASRYLGPSLAAELEASAQQAYRVLLFQLASQQTAATGPLLARKNGRVQLALSSGTQSLEQAVSAYLAQSFVEPSSGGRLRLPADWQRLVWDVGLVQQGEALIDAYDDYVAKELASFPADMQLIAQQVALENLERNLFDVLARAQTFRVAPESSTVPVPPQLLEADLRVRLGNFQTLAAPFTSILDDLLRLRLAAAYEELAVVLERQQLQILSDDSRLLDQQQLYTTLGLGFAWWDGLTPPAPAAFGASDAKGLAAYLANELSLVTRLAQSYAQPVVQFAAQEKAVRQRSDAFTRELERWSGILADLDAQQNKRPGNAVTNLETFIGSDLTAVNLRTCFGEPRPTPGAPLPASYFATRQALLEGQLGLRCDTLAAEYGYACFREMATLFNERLALRFPYAPLGPSPYRAGAEPAALTDFFGLYDNGAWLVGEVPASVELFGPEIGAVTRFLGAMGESRAFLAPFLDDPKSYPVPTVGYTVEFRVRPREERGAEDVIGWTFGVGTKAINRGDSDLTGTWAYGAAPTSVTLRWALDSPRVPLATIARDLGRLDGLSAIFEHDDPWSLVALLVAHRVPATSADPKPEALRFVVETAPAGSAGKSSSETNPSDTSLGELYLRVSLVTPDRKSPLLLPSEFPRHAPQVPLRQEWANCPTIPAPAPATPAASSAPGSS